MGFISESKKEVWIKELTDLVTHSLGYANDKPVCVCLQFVQCAKASECEAVIWVRGLIVEGLRLHGYYRGEASYKRCCLTNFSSLMTFRATKL